MCKSDAVTPLSSSKTPWQTHKQLQARPCCVCQQWLKSELAVRKLIWHMSWRVGQRQHAEARLCTARQAGPMISWDENPRVSVTPGVPQGQVNEESGSLAGLFCRQAEFDNMGLSITPVPLAPLCSLCQLDLVATSRKASSYLSIPHQMSHQITDKAVEGIMQII